MNNVGQHLLSGALSGFTSTLCLQPLDLLKTRLQQRDGTSGKRDAGVIIRTAREVLALHGVRGLWRGTAASLVRNVPGIAMYMTTLSQVRTVMSTSPYFARVRKRASNLNGITSSGGSVLPTLTSQGNVLAGAASRVTVGFILNPFSVLKARYESSHYAYQSFGAAFISLLRGGPSELFRGFLASALRDAPYAGLFVVCYEGIKHQASHALPSDLVVSAGIHSLSAGCASTLATTITHPFDVIKTKVQVRSEDRYRGFARTVRTIWSNRGAMGFFDGLSLRLSRKVLSSAIGWAIYEGVLTFMVSRTRSTEES